jgi:hypothetical protein
LSAGAVALIGKWTPRGDWLTATAYAANDLVTESNNLYVCIVAHTSGTFATDLAAGDWQLIDGDTARAGADNTFTGVNTFSGVVNFDGAVDFDDAVDMTGGTPTVATKAAGDNTQAPASTAFVQAAVGKVYPPQVFTSPPTTVTVTIASPAVLSWTAHGLPIGGAFQVTTSGALPTGASASTTYYVISAGFGANSFRFSATPGGAAINTTGSQSGTHTGTPFYVPRAGMVNCIIENWGGGGGGGGSASPGSNLVGGGGGAGSPSRKVATASDIGAGKLVTIGAAGAAGAAGNNAGGAGGDTSVGSLCIGKGGSGGAGAAASATSVVSTGGLGGVLGTGDVRGTGAPGQSVTCYSAATAGIMTGGGSGGSSSVGGGGRSPMSTSATTGEAATGFAAGGSGGTSINGAGTAAGGAGTPGYAVITEFCNQ